MICTVLVCEPLALGTKVFLHQRVDDEFLADGVSSDFPDKLAGPTVLSVSIASALDILVIVCIHLHFTLGGALLSGHRTRTS